MNSNKCFDDAESVHGQLLGFMQCHEQEKHQMQFKTKLLSLKECVYVAEMWVLNVEGNFQDRMLMLLMKVIQIRRLLVSIKSVTLPTMEEKKSTNTSCCG